MSSVPTLELDPPPAGTPRILITLGTIFSEPHLLTAIIDAVSEHTSSPPKGSPSTILPRK
ncbi:hypothetical protein LTT66_32220 [Nocardia gipuzkoensis]|uniref:hypothetical protein n=1 Tax=Nocardia gipuzkoensis TaxID=2749991 RepID=UPI001E32D531|nr:hypothetical protein [Nocardia gipuzkoensis]UGT67802.1 hypothetical protein LTT66_32220 [Nocardia gipuzkoensis]